MSAGRGIHQGLQRRQQFRIRFGQRLASAAQGADAHAHARARVSEPVCQVAGASHNSVAGHARSQRHGADTTPSQVRRFRRRPLSTHPFIHQFGERLKLELDALYRGSVLRGCRLGLM